MTILRQGRLFYWFIRALTDKYTKNFIFGVVVGIVATVAAGRLLMPLIPKILTRDERTAVIGEYSVSDLPDHILGLLSQGLTQLSDSGMPLPALADSWESTDEGKTYTFLLNQDKFWHDGKKVTAEDVNYNIQNVTVQNLDPAKVQFRINMQYSPFPVVVSKPIFRKGLIGTGQYKVTNLKIRAGVFTTLTFTPVNPKLPNKIYTFYKTIDQAILAYKMGEVDRVDDIPSVDTSFRHWKNTTVTENSNYKQMVILFYNVNDPVLKEKQVRQALAYAIPDFGFEHAGSPLSIKSWAYTDTVKHYTYDESQAQKLFEQAKIASASPSLTIHTFSSYAGIANTIAEKWTSLGIKTSVAVENVVPDNYQVFITARELPPDPDQYALWHSTQKNTNISGYASAKIDKLLEDGRINQDIDTRKKIYADFQKWLVDDAPAVFLFYPKVYTIIRK